MTAPTTTTYLLDCGHRADVPGPHGATTGRAWCSTCGESRAVDLMAALEASLSGTVRECEACGGPEPVYDAHGWFCQPCRDADGAYAGHVAPGFVFGVMAALGAVVLVVPFILRLVTVAQTLNTL